MGWKGGSGSHYPLFVSSKHQIYLRKAVNPRLSELVYKKKTEHSTFPGFIVVGRHSLRTAFFKRKQKWELCLFLATFYKFTYFSENSKGTSLKIKYLICLILAFLQNLFKKYISKELWLWALDSQYIYIMSWYLGLK